MLFYFYRWIPIQLLIYSDYFIYLLARYDHLSCVLRLYSPLSLQTITDKITDCHNM